MISSATRRTEKGGGLGAKLTTHRRSFHLGLGRAAGAYGMSRGPAPEGGWKYVARKGKGTMAERKQEGLLIACALSIHRLKCLFHSGDPSPAASVRWRENTFPWGLFILGPHLLPAVTLHARDPPLPPRFFSSYAFLPTSHAKGPPSFPREPPCS